MSAADVLSELAHRGVQLQVVEDRLRFFPQSAVGPELLERVRLHKPELIELLNTAAWEERTHHEAGRLVLHDPAFHNGELVWDDDADTFLWDCFASKREPSPPKTTPWPGWLADFVLLLAPDDLPPRLRLDAATVVTDTAKYLAGLRADIRQGASGPRAAVVKGDLEQLIRALPWLT